MADSGVYKFTPRVQLRILTLLWLDNKMYYTYKEVIKPKYFTSPIHIDLCRIIYDYREKYEASPSKDVLLEEIHQMCSKSKTKARLEQDYIDTINRMAEVDVSTDYDYLKDKIVSFGKRQALVEAILQSADILEKEPESSYSKISNMIQLAMMTGEGTEDLGVNYWDNFEERIYSYGSEPDVIERFSTGIDMLDGLMNGGIGRTEMFVCIAPPGRGKTTMLIWLACAALVEGKNVLHITLENNLNQVLRNYDITMMNQSTNYMKDNPEKVIRAMTNAQEYCGGQLYIRKYQPKSLTVTQLRLYMNRLELVEGFHPDVLVVDYGMIMKSEDNYVDKRSNIEGIYEDLRAIADEFNCAVYTAAQGNRGSLSKRVVTLGDIAECFAIANTADTCVALCQNNSEKSEGVMRMFIAKNRDNPDGMMLKGTIDYDRKLINMTETVDAEELSRDSAKDSKDSEDEAWGS